jgi:hypothetical protein
LSFYFEFDVWGRFYTHFEDVEVVTFVSVTQHFSRLNTPAHDSGKTQKTIIFERTKEEEGIEKEKRKRRYRFPTVVKDVGVDHNNTCKQH